MEQHKLLNFTKEIIKNSPADWLNLTTHRLDVYNEQRAKDEFLVHLERLYQENRTETSALEALPTAFDYIRLGHPLSSVLEWYIAHLNQVRPKQVISFSSKTMPILAVLRKNLLTQKATRIAYSQALPACFDPAVVRQVYGYNFELCRAARPTDLAPFEGSTIYLTQEEDLSTIAFLPTVDFYLSTYRSLGSIIVANGPQNLDYISEIQHVRRRESIAMTPANALVALQRLIGQETAAVIPQLDEKKKNVVECIQHITGAKTPAVVGSSGLSIQYAIGMGLIHDALERYAGKAIKFIVPPNCYGGTNDQARRVAACLDGVEVVDLPVDGDNDMVRSIDRVLQQVAQEDAVPFIIVEIPTNPRVEVPDLDALQAVLSKVRHTGDGQPAVDPVFILDQTFCPDVPFLGAHDILADVRTVSYVSGSKFPSGGRCTAGYCQTNKKGADLMEKIALHLKLCDNEATNLQIAILAEQLPSMKTRIWNAYKNTRAFVNFIQEVLPAAKINFVSEALAERGFTPSVFSLDLPTQGATAESREQYKRALNNKLITMMIREIPTESKYCVSYGQLKGCYWTIPATSTQGTTKEQDKDYIARISCSPDMDLERHKAVFLDFVRVIEATPELISI
jgi:cystathionine beta-lyase/cystathionine gamma-synthase